MRNAVNNDKILLVWPLGQQGAFGGPSGFIDQLFRRVEHKRVQLSNPFSPLQQSRLQHFFSICGALTRKGTIRAARGYEYRRAVWDAMFAERYSHLWFMSDADFGLCQEFISDDQYVIFQPHCPEAPWMEIPSDSEENIKYRQQREASTKAAFQRANCLVLPNSHAEEIYVDLIRPGTRIEYILSASAQLASSGRFEFDNRLSHFLFVGRRNSIKGFDLLIDAFSEACRHRNDIRLIVVGNGELLGARNVIDAGPSTRVSTWIRSADCVLNVNRMSYFDLSLMETLSLGTPIAMTKTGGHAWFDNERNCSPGIHLLPEPSVSAIADFLIRFKAEPTKRQHFEAANSQIYHNNFTPELYRDRVDRFAISVLEAAK